MSMLALYKKSSFAKFKKWLHEWENLIGTILTLITTFIIAIFVTNAVTNSQKKTEFFLDFTKRYQVISDKAQKLNKEIANKHPTDSKYQLSSIEESDARQIYFELFGLIYDEYTAHQADFLDEKAIVNWLTWQIHDLHDKKFTIGGVLYEDAWNEWLNGPARDHSLTPVIKAIFDCRDRKCVKRTISQPPPELS
jgi:hypothetical protein